MPYNDQTLVDQALVLLQTAGRASSDAIDATALRTLIPAAISLLSRFCPREVYAELSGDGESYRIALSGLAVAWVNDFSQPMRVQWPLNDSLPDGGPDLPRKSYGLYPSIGNATHLRLGFIAPVVSSGNTNKVGLHYIVPHSIDGTSTTVPVHLQPALEFVLGSFGAGLLATGSGFLTSVTLEGDNTNHGGRRKEWSDAKLDLLGEAARIIGTEDLSGPSWAGSGRAQQWGS